MDKLFYCAEGMIECVVRLTVYLLGGLDRLLIALLILAGCEAVSRTAKLWYLKDTSLKEIYEMILKKGAMFILLIAANQLDLVIGSSDQFMRSAVLIFMIGKEGFLILEHIKTLGLEAPDVMTHIVDEFAGSKKDEDKPEQK
ncbi:phage holin family protein [Peribacillus deserti]|uniref:Holin n=1 Tax=Peribacillus deserti TaxID=673318 RepID=A0A2N5M8L8_9BACI|nr:phage holin family protein [Peribacillus deserti]PLT30708.1 holin [Peribacillus deserti]